MASLLRLLAVAASVLVLIGFGTFIADQAGSASKQQVSALGTELDDPSPSAQAEAARERAHGSVRELVDDANDVLLTPFSGIVSSKNVWVERGVPTLLALLVYGVGLGLLANAIPAPARHAGGDWRTT